MRPFYAIRALGGLLYVAGSLIMAYNLWRTIRGDVASEKLPAAMPFAARA
jgi:cytochrome c oxidase cbb3-type subunit 1